MVIREFVASDVANWDSFVRKHPNGSPFHLTAWRQCIEETFGYRPVYLLAEEQGQLEAVLPLFEVNNLLMGRVLLSSPFSVYGGVLANSAEAKAAMATYLREFANKRSVQYVELRNSAEDQCLGFSQVSRYVTFLQQIGADEEKLLAAIPRKTRYMVRKALKHAFESRETHELASFFDLYTQSLRRLGTPAFPKRHFENIMRLFGKEARITEILLEGRVVSTVLSFTFGDQILPYYGASDPAYNEQSPNNFMYFDLMRRAGVEGFKVFDFGRSKKEGSGSFDFKAHWGMEMRELPYEYLLVKRKDLPHFSPSNSGFSLAIQMWQKVPLPITRAIGPWLLKLVP
jgi:FemAB-related protein (PEP-CTERM system-associated)